MAGFDEKAAYEAFKAHKQSGADLSRLDPICHVLGEYLRDNPPRFAGRVLPNRIIALHVINEVLAWEKAVWEHE